MAVVAVISNNTRIDDAEALTGWLGIGGGQGASAEPSFPYQGTNLVNRKVTSSTGAGFYYDPTGDGGSSQNMTSASLNTWMVKCIVTDPGGLQSTNGVQIRIGSGTNAYYEYIVAGSLSPLSSYSQYPAKQGLIIIPINPNVAGYRNSTSGSPSLTAVDYFGLLAAFVSSTAKSENVGLDAIDLGTGLTLTGGDGGDTDGKFTDFSDFDEGNTSNRFGYATLNNGIVFLFGTIQIGSATATGFTDNDTQVIMPDGYYDSGWSSIDIDLSNASTVVAIGNSISSLGTLTIVDTRADFNVTGTSGSLTLNGTLSNFRNVVLTSSVTVDGATIDCLSLTQSNSTISNTTINTSSTSGNSTVINPNFTNLTNTVFNQSGSGHAIELQEGVGNVSLTGLTFNGYGANGSNSSAINYTGTTPITLAYSGGTEPTVTGNITVLQNQNTLTLTGLVNPTKVYLVDTSLPETDVNFLLDSQNITTGTYTYTFNQGANINALYRLISLGRNVVEQDVLLGSVDLNIPISQQIDRVYENN